MVNNLTKSSNIPAVGYYHKLSSGLYRQHYIYPTQWHLGPPSLSRVYRRIIGSGRQSDVRVLDSDPGLYLLAVWVSLEHLNVHGHVLRANIVLISHFLGVSHSSGDVGRPEYRSDPESDLSSKWLSPKPHQKHTVVHSGLIQSLLATF